MRGTACQQCFQALSQCLKHPNNVENSFFILQFPAIVVALMLAIIVLCLLCPFWTNHHLIILSSNAPSYFLAWYLWDWLVFELDNVQCMLRKYSVTEDRLMDAWHCHCCANDKVLRDWHENGIIINRICVYGYMCVCVGMCRCVCVGVCVCGIRYRVNSLCVHDTLVRITEDHYWDFSSCVIFMHMKSKILILFAVIISTIRRRQTWRRMLSVVRLALTR